MKILINSILIAGMFSLVSCATFRTMGVNAIAPSFNEIIESAYKMNDSLILKEGIPSNIILLEGLLGFSPDNRDLLALTAQAYCSYALGFIEDTDPERAKKLYLRGRDFGLRALKVNKKFRKIVNKEKDFKKAAAVLDEEYIPDLFWTGFCWASWLNLSKKDPVALYDISNIVALMERVKDLDGKYFNGGPHLFFAMYYSGLPVPMGGPEKAQAEFDKVFEITGGKFLMAKAFYARFYATIIKDEELFDKTIEEILNTPSDIDPNLAVMNEIAKTKARHFRNQRMDFF